MDIPCGKTFLSIQFFFDPVILTSSFDLNLKKLTLAIHFEPKEILRDYKSLGGGISPVGIPSSRVSSDSGSYSTNPSVTKANQRIVNCL